MAAEPDPPLPSVTAFSAPVFSQESFVPPALRISTRPFKGGGKRQPLGDADGEFPFAFQLTQGKEILPTGIILNGGDPVAGGLGQRQGQPAFSLLGSEVGDETADKSGGFLFEPSGWFPHRVPYDFAAFGVESQPSDTGLFEREGIGHPRVAVHASEEHRMATGDRVQVPTRRHAILSPQRMVPATARDPFSGSIVAHAVANTPLEFGYRAGGFHLDAQHSPACAAQVGAGVVETGHDEPAL